MVGVAAGAVLVVAGAGTWAAVEGAEGPLVDGVIEAAVADVGGQYGAFLSQGITAGQVLDGLQRRGVVLAQRTAQSVGVPDSGPDEILMSPR